MGVQNSILFPLTQIAFDNSQAGVSQPNFQTILIGQTVTQQPTVLTAVYSVAQAIGLFGAGSMLARMFDQYVDIDAIGPIQCLPLADATGATKATGTFTFMGPATGNGTIFAMIGGQAVNSGVASGNTAAQMATNLAAAVNALPSLPVTAASAAGVVTVTAKNGGTLGNSIDLRLNYAGLAASQTLPAGVGVAIAAMSGGATDPALTGVAGILGDRPAYIIAHPYSNSPAMQAFATLMSFAGGRWDPTRKSFGHVWTARSDLLANLSTYGITNNDPHSTVFAYETGSPMWEPEAAAMYAAAFAASLRSGLPNRPGQTLPIPGFLAPNSSGGTGTETAWNTTAWQELLGVGLALAAYDGGGNATILRSPTTYQTNAYGQPDQSYFDTEDVYLLMNQGFFLNSFFTQNFGRVLIADDGTAFGPGLPITTPKLMKAALVSAYTQMQTMGWVEDTDAFIAATSVVRDTQNAAQVDILFAPFNVVGLRNIATTVQFRKFSAANAAIVQAAA